MPSPAVPVVRPKRMVASIGMSILLFAGIGIIPFFLMSKGCSSSEGSFQSTGAPLGDFTLVPKHCKSGEHEGFYGVFVLPEAENQGGLKIVQDPVQNRWVIHVELPGSCVGGTCKVVTLDATRCSKYDVSVERTNTTVNDIRLLDGKLELACAFEGGSVNANIRFESCD